MFTNYQTTLGIGRASNWQSPVICNKYLMILSESIEKVDKVVGDLSCGLPYSYEQRLSNIECLGPLATYLHYFKNGENNSLIYLISMAMGNSVVSQIGTTGIYQRVITLDTNIAQKVLTLAIDKITSIHELGTVKINGFKITGTIGQLITVEFSIIANNRIIDSAINTKVVIDGLALSQILESDNLIPLTLNAATCEIGEYNILRTEFGISAFEIVFNRGLSYDFVSNGFESLEPIEDGQPKFEFNITMDYYNVKDFISKYNSRTICDSALKFLGNYISDGYSNEWIFQFNRMVLVNETDIINNSGLQPLTLKFIPIADENYGNINPLRIFITGKEHENIS